MAEQTFVAKVVKIIDKNKAKAAFAAPFVLALGGSLASYVVTGDFNEAEVRTAVGGFVTACTAALAAYLAPSKEAEVVQPIVPVPPGEDPGDVAKIV